MKKLGPFELIEVIGSGGMGQVWRGRHLREDVPVAIKLVRGQVSERMRAQFEREVQAHAGLSHPGVVFLFDYGVVTPALAKRFQAAQQLQAGAPYLAMELADGGTLRDLMPLSDWNSIHTIISSVLDALAHAHARDLIHRDLKPENILIFESPSGPRPKLADFGIAHALRTEHRASADELADFSGTPYYMPPEQARGKWRSYGPWTDLYALGCVIWEMVSGTPIFLGNSTIEVIYQHCGLDRPALTPQIEVPKALQNWLLRMVAAAPNQRFQSAAQALHHLPAPLDSEQDSQPPDSRSRSRTSPGNPLGGDGVEAPTQLLDTAPTRLFESDSQEFHAIQHTLGETPGLDPIPPTGADTAAATGAPRPIDIAPFPLPSSWRRRRAAPIADPLAGAGLGLFGLREIPFVDRDRARDAIWSALDEVIQTRQMRVVFLVGGPGSGKSSLAEFMATRADEVGAVQRLLATHSSGGAAQLDGLPGAWRRTLRTFGLSRLELYQRLRELLVEGTTCARDAERWERRARALTEWIEPAPPNSGEEHGPRHQFSSPAERYILAHRILQKIVNKNAVLLTLDDLQWGPDSLNMLDFLLQSPHPDPTALVLVTLRSDLLAEDEPLARRIDTLVAHSKCQRIDLAPLEPVFHRDLIRRMLHLEEDLLEQIALKTEGNPLFVTQLLRHLIDRDQLEVGAYGFRLAEAAEDVLPPDIFSLWAGRIDRLVNAYPSHQRQAARHAIELAAALGRQVSTQEWEAVCRQASLTIPPRLLARLRARGLADNIPGGFEFTHGLLVESLARQAAQDHRWINWNRCCAEMLTHTPNLSPESSALRRAQHWLITADYKPAIEALISGGKHQFATGLGAAGFRTLKRAEHTLDQINASPCDPNRIEINLELASSYRARGEEEHAERLLEHAQYCLEYKLNNPRLKAEMFFARAWPLQRAGRAQDAIALLEQALALFQQITHPRQALCLRHLAVSYLSLGELDRALTLAREAYAVARAHNLPPGRFHIRLSKVLSMMGRTEKATEHLHLAQQSFEEENNILGLVHIENEFGELARSAGDLAKAEQHYRRFFELCQEADRAFDMAIAQINIGIVLFTQQKHDAAGAIFERGRQHANATSFHFAEFVTLCGLLATAAAQSNWADFDRANALLSSSFSNFDQVDPDAAMLLSAAGESAFKPGEHPRARSVLELAAHQWSALGDTQHLSEVQALLARL